MNEILDSNRLHGSTQRWTLVVGHSGGIQLIQVFRYGRRPTPWMPTYRTRQSIGAKLA